MSAKSLHSEAQRDELGFICLFLFDRIEAAREPHPVQGMDRVELRPGDARFALDLDHVMVGAEGAALGAVVKGHQLKARVTPPEIYTSSRCTAARRG